MYNTGHPIWQTYGQHHLHEAVRYSNSHAEAYRQYEIPLFH